MRQAVACEGTTAEYRLQVRIDGALVADRVVHGGGLRRDPSGSMRAGGDCAARGGDGRGDVRFDRVESNEPGVAAREHEREGTS